MLQSSAIIDAGDIISIHGGMHQFLSGVATAGCQEKAREQLFLWYTHPGPGYVCAILR